MLNWCKLVFFIGLHLNRSVPNSSTTIKPNRRLNYSFVFRHSLSLYFYGDKEKKTPIKLREKENENIKSSPSTQQLLSNVIKTCSEFNYFWSWNESSSHVRNRIIWRRCVEHFGGFYFWCCFCSALLETANNDVLNQIYFVVMSLQPFQWNGICN